LEPKVNEERWYYADGRVVFFKDGVAVEVITPPAATAEDK